MNILFPNVKRRCYFLYYCFVWNMQSKQCTFDLIHELLIMRYFVLFGHIFGKNRNSIHLINPQNFCFALHIGDGVPEHFLPYGAIREFRCRPK